MSKETAPQSKPNTAGVSLDLGKLFSNGVLSNDASLELSKIKPYLEEHTKEGVEKVFLAKGPISLVNNVEGNDEIVKVINFENLNFEDKEIETLVGNTNINNEGENNSLDNFPFIGFTGYLRDFRETPTTENVSQAEVENSSIPITRRIIPEGLKKFFKRVVAFGSSAAILSSVVSAAEIKPNITVVSKGEGVDERYSGGALANVDASSIKLLGTIETQQPVMRPDGLATAIETSVQVEVKNTSGIKVIVQIGEKFCLVSNPNVSGGNNVLQENDTRPEIINNRTMVPVRLISESLGVTVGWNGEDKSISLKKGNKEIEMQIGNSVMEVNNNGDIKEFVLDSPPVINKDSRTLVPVRAIAEAFGIPVQWDEKTRTVFINYTETEKNSLLEGSGAETKISAYPEFLGNLEQRTLLNLEESYRASWASGDRKGTNPLGLDYNDILEFKKTGSTENCKYIELIKVSDNLGFICVVGGTCGFQKEESMENMKIAVEKCNKVNPEIMKRCVENGLKFMSAGRASGPIFIGVREDWGATFDEDTIYVNEKNVYLRDPTTWASIMIEESYGIFYRKISGGGMGKATIDGVIYNGAAEYKREQHNLTFDTNFPDWVNGTGLGA